MGNFSSYTKNVNALEAAYEQGHLLGHNFEFNSINFAAINNSPLESFFNVLAGNPDANFTNQYRNVYGKDGGFQCLATSFFVKDVPTKPFIYKKNVGMLLNGNDDVNINYIGASLDDLVSLYKKKEPLIISAHMTPKATERWVNQFPQARDPFQIDLIYEVKFGKERNDMVRSVIQEIIELNRTNTPQVNNEVLVNAKIGAVCGLVHSINNKTSDLVDVHLAPAFSDELSSLEMLALKAYIKEKHDIDLPLMVYDMQQQDHEKRLSPMKIDRDRLKEIKQVIGRSDFEAYGSYGNIPALLSYAERGFKLHERDRRAELV